MALQMKTKNLKIIVKLSLHEKFGEREFKEKINKWRIIKIKIIENCRKKRAKDRKGVGAS